MTQREEIIKLLKSGNYNINYLAERFDTIPKKITEDLKHISKSVHPMKLLVTVPAECKICEYKFTKDDNKFRTPGKCPKCKSEKIFPSFFQIK